MKRINKDPHKKCNGISVKDQFKLIANTNTNNHFPELQQDNSKKDYLSL